VRVVAGLRWGEGSSSIFGSAAFLECGYRTIISFGMVMNISLFTVDEQWMEAEIPCWIGATLEVCIMATTFRCHAH
jgi:hypothetical protein